jgi:hypothetical protein
MKAMHVLLPSSLLLGALLPATAGADIREDSGFGLITSVDESGGWPTGVTLGTPDGDVSMGMAWAKGSAGRTRMHSWWFDLGYWGPAPGYTVNAPTMYNYYNSDGKKDTTEPGAWVTAPYTYIGGDRRRGERLEFRSDATVMWNWLSYGDVALMMGSFGPLLGCSVDMIYPPKDSADPKGQGSFDLILGLAGGGFVDETFSVRGVTRLLWEPLVTQDARVEGGILLGVNLEHDKEAPFGFQLSGRIRQELRTDWTPEWRVMLGAIIVPEL